MRTTKLGVALAIGTALTLSACWNTDTTYFLLDVSGTVDGGGLDAPVFLEFFYAYAGEGDLRHPLVAIDDAEMKRPGSFSLTLDYRPDVGEGLVVFAWVDRDGDGILCAPGVYYEGTDLVEVEAPLTTGADDLYLRPLVTPCAPPEELWP